MAQRQLRSDDSSVFSERFGDGSDGAYSPSTGTDSPINASCTGTAGATTLSATNASFAAGQIIIIHQTQGAAAGLWEFNKISSYSAGTITLSHALINSYGAGAQVQVMKQYSSANIAGGVTITISGWNGTTGGLYGFFCNGPVTIAGTITADGKGFRGNAETIPTNGTGSVGEGYLGNNAFPTNTNTNGSGGGGAQFVGFSAAGGGNGTAGGNGTFNSGSGTQAIGGSAYGTADLVTGTFGGAGGSTDDNAGNSGLPVPGSGGGMIVIVGANLTVTGTITNAGTSGNPPTGGIHGGSGGGAGGSILLKTQTAVLGTNLITASGASGTSGTGGGSAGASGGDGRIHIDYGVSLSGSTTPTLDSRQDASLAPFIGATMI